MKKKASVPVEKNKRYVMKIDSLANAGEGVGKIDGFTIFVEGALPQEEIEVLIVKVKKHFAYGKLQKIMTPSPERAEPLCGVSAMCGGCQLQHLSYAGQLEYKTKKVEEALKRIGKIEGVKVLPAIGMQYCWRYRNKAQFPVKNAKGKLEIGFYGKRSHRIIDTEKCFLQKEISDEVIAAVRGFLEEYHISIYNEQMHKGLIRHILVRVGFYSGQVMVCIVANGKQLPHCDALIKKLKNIKGMASIVLNENREKTNVILGQKNHLLWGKAYIEDSIGSLVFEISPLSFFQVNPVQTKLLYEKALEMAQLKGNETVLDLYCGIGTISLFFAQKAKKVIGVELVPEAIADAKRNAEKNHIENAAFFVGAAEDVIPLFYQKGLRADVIVVDPPRKGCDDKVIETMIEMNPKKIVYVSCDPSTMARDVSKLKQAGYALIAVQPVDQFPMTNHVETVVLLSQQKPDDTIEIDLDLDELDATAAKTKATYEEIKAYVWEKHNMKVSSLYISQVKRKCGLEVGQNYNLSKSENPKVPKCPTEKEAAIMDALKHFQMI